MRTLVRLVIFILGVYTLGVALSPLFPAEILQHDIGNLLDSSVAWKASLFGSLLFGLGRYLRLAFRQKLRFPVFLCLYLLATFVCLTFTVAPEWNPLPIEVVMWTSVPLIGWTGLCFMFMRVFPKKIVGDVLELKQVAPPEAENPFSVVSRNENPSPPIPQRQGRVRLTVVPPTRPARDKVEVHFTKPPETEHERLLFREEVFPLVRDKRLTPLSKAK